MSMHNQANGTHSLPLYSLILCLACTRLWQEGLGDVAEKEMMTQLLAALRKVMGFDERAQKLARSYGETGIKHLLICYVVG